MASGFQCSWANREKELGQMQEQTDWAGFMLDLPFSSKPGEKFYYCSGNFYLLAEILQRATKLKSHDFAIKKIFIKNAFIINNSLSTAHLILPV
jgi:CubicO group peptidase (beta-lactamase class C family)